MIVLPMNAKDDDFDGQRKWSQAVNDDGTISMQDETEYREKGTDFGALEYNTLCAAIQGFTGGEAEFSSDKKTITESDEYGRKKITRFQKDEEGNNQIIETLYDEEGGVIGVKTTTMMKNRVKEEVSK